MKKLIYIWLSRRLTMLLYIFPIKKNRILFYSFSGREYSDSPKYISEYLEEHYPDEYEIVWAVNDVEKWKYLNKKGYRIVRYKSFAHIVQSITSKIIVTNTGPFKAVKARESQYIINTWHGGGAYKKTGRDNPYKDKYKKIYNEIYGQAGVNLFLTSSKAFSKFVIKGAFNYSGEILECGLPRNDRLITQDTEQVNDISRKVRRILDIPEKKKIVLYAPTWKNYKEDDYEKISPPIVINALENKTGSEWFFVYRGHNLSSRSWEFQRGIANATDYEDMQELLLAADVLISDYSSCIWDFSLMKKPCFLFVPDLDKYDSVFSFYTPITSWGFLVCKNNIALEEQIAKFSSEQYKNAIEDNHRLFENVESGNAAEQVCDWIRKIR